MEANPTQGELLFKEFKNKTTEVRTRKKDSILDRYGGEEHLYVPKDLLLGQTDHYIEYEASGRIKHGREKMAVKSKYPEDMYFTLT